MKLLKILCGLVCLALLVAQVRSMSHWSEARGVYDDVCYLRQAHLFQRFGLGGIDTDISRDDDGYLAAKLREIGFPGNAMPPCHTPMPATGKLVLQYPPGTGLVLALFPQGHQVIPLFVTATLIIFGFALLGIFRARTITAVLATAAFGCLAIYIMVNPSKASYSMAPTTVVCAVAGFVTARLFAGGQKRERVWLVIALGLLLGLSVNFRLPNLFLASGYLLFFAVAVLASRRFDIALRGLCFGAALVVGMAPTLIANVVNAGSPFATTYGGQDVAPPGFSLDIAWQYLGDMQFVLVLLAVAAAVTGLRRRDAGVRRVALLTIANLAANLAFFLSHPLFTPYYTIPIAMLSLWSLSFAMLTAPARTTAGELAGQAANAGS